ncbi:MAG: hypothetical protein KA715_08310 [Xanthomonadaceae bacterium]|nr:hypothetical protein [Xanthomonadaceae bacterium]
MNLKGFAAITKGERVLLSFSGGSKSAIAASILAKQGYQVTAVHFTKRESKLFPCTANRVDQVNELVGKLGIEVHFIDIADQYQLEVEERFLHERTMALTSNPCLRCQGKLCFEPLVAAADKMGIRWISTGHCAQLMNSNEGDKVHVYQAMDPSVDESEFLVGLDQSVLKRLILPLGTLNQSMLFKLAVQFELAEVDSEEKIFSRTAPCFDPYSKETQDWIARRLPHEFTRKGIIRTAEQEIVGAHDGLFRYPLGLGTRELKIESEPTKYLVIESFDAKSNELRIGPKKLLDHKGFIMKSAFFIIPVDQMKTNMVSVKFQSRKELFSGEVMLFETGRVKLLLGSSISKVGLGESVAFYFKQELLGGAVVEAYADE